jgi:hypothetical protein
MDIPLEAARWLEQSFASNSVECSSSNQSQSNCYRPE